MDFKVSLGSFSQSWTLNLQSLYFKRKRSLGIFIFGRMQLSRLNQHNSYFYIFRRKRNFIEKIVHSLGECEETRQAGICRGYKPTKLLV